MIKTIYGFEILDKNPLPEFNGFGIFARHKKTGLELYHIFNDDNENLFSYNFTTQPKNSTGVAHILEHTVLCGSKNYPLRDPFLVLVKQSVTSFLNAMTYPDKTVFPAASVVEADYFNLMSVFGDAVFFPKLEKWAFKQEGHRIEIDKNGKPRLRGVVLNEMRAEYSDFDSIAYDSSINLLCKNTIYENDSGGHPLEIPNLSYKEYLAFHKKFYHPVNCKIFLMGNIPTEKQLKFLDENFLSKFEPQKRPSLIEPIKPLKKPLKKTFKAPINEKEDDTKDSLILSWLLPEAFKTEKLIQAYLVAQFLMGHNGAYMNKILLEKNICNNLCPDNGVSKSIRNITFTIGIKETSLTDDEFEILIFDALQDLLEKNIDDEEIETAVHSIEFSNREIIRGTHPFSLILMERAMTAWNHGLEPESSLRYVPVFEKIKKDICNTPDYLKNLIKEFLTNNKNYSIATIKPDKKFSKKIDKKLKNRAKKIFKNMNDIQKQNILKEQKEAEEFNKKPIESNLKNLIPHISKKDLPPLPKPSKEDVQLIGGVPIISYTEPTNGIGYFNLMFPIDNIDSEDYKYLPLLCLCIESMGTNKLSWSESSSKLASLLGGFSINCSILSGKNYGELTIFKKFKQILPEQIIGRDWIMINGKMLGVLIPQAMDFVFEFIANTNFNDKQRLSDLIKQRKNNFESIPALEGNALAMMTAMAPLSQKAALKEMLSGFSQLKFLRNLHRKITDKNSLNKNKDLNFLIEKFYQLRETIFNSGLIIGIIGTKLNIENFNQVLSKKLHIFSAPKNKQNYNFKNKFEFKNNKKNRLALIPASVQVGFAVSIFKGAKFGTRDEAIQAVLARWLSIGILWDRLRNIGGAYGAFVIPMPLEERLAFVSVRDPNPINSLNEFLKALEEITQKQIDQKEIDALIIGRYSSEITPKTPAMRAVTRFTDIFSGTPFIIQEKIVKEMLSVTGEELKIYAKKLLNQKYTLSCAVLASKEDLQLHGQVKHFLSNQVMMEKI